MDNISATLIDALQVERLDRLLFRGFTPQPTLPRVFGGQVMAQAMNAAARTIGEKRLLHSYHAYFLRPGNPDKPIIYTVDPIRDGGSFTTRCVTASQDGQAIFNCHLSFMKESSGYQHADPMPENIPAPESLESKESYDRRMTMKCKEYPKSFAHQLGWDIRHIRPNNLLGETAEPPVCEHWFRFTHEIPDKPLLHKTLLAYISDLGLMMAGVLPHKINFFDNSVQLASLDHSMYFHNTGNVNDWMFYKTRSHWAGGGRGLNIGTLYQQDGTLIATAIQEGLMRPYQKPENN